MKKTITLLVNLLLVCLCSQAAPERKQLFDSDWKFSLNDTVSWRQVDLPHDWSIELDPVESAPGGGAVGYFPTGT